MEKPIIYLSLKNMEENFLQQLNNFLGKASLSTYAGGGENIDPEEPMFKELEYKEGKWYYKDSYAGFFQSWGREVVWLNNKPIWNQIYGGGMVEKFQNDEKFAHETFDFLKKALSAGEKVKEFQPRGAKSYLDGDWEYKCDWSGDISRFQGHESIKHKGEEVFIHDFLGGLIIAK